MVVQRIPSGKDGPDMAKLFGPGMVDQQLRQAIQTCWWSLPKAKRTVAGVEAEIRRLVERALKDMREDAAAFGMDQG